MGSEARLHPRLRINAKADIIGEEVVLGRPLDNISMGGCSVGGHASEAEGSEVQMVLSFPTHGTNLPVYGTVVRANDSAMGIRFSDLSDEQKWALRKHIREAQSQSQSQSQSQ